MNIHFLHTNDVHSSIENHMRLGRLLRQRRDRLQSLDEFVVTVDIGDVLDRVRPETEVTFGIINAEVMKALGYDAWVFGNNEGLTIPKDHWPELIAQSGATLLSSNLRQPDGGEFPFGVDYLIREWRGVKVGMIGVTERYELPYGVLGVEVRDPFETVAQLKCTLAAESCHVVVVLSHLGLWRDRQLADAVSGIDLILGGHSHHFMDQPEVVNGTTIFQTGKHALAFGHTEIEIDVETKRVLDIRCERIDVPVNVATDDAMYRTYSERDGVIQERLGQSVFSLPSSLPVQLDQESAFANVLVDALHHTFTADVGIMMAGALTASLLPGSVSVRDILGACSTPTRPIRLTLSGDDIWAILEKGVQSAWYHRVGFGYGFRGSVIGYLAISNMLVDLDDEPSGCLQENPKIKRIHVGGRPLEREQSYRVVTCEFLWLSSAFEEFHRGRDVQFETPLVREVLLKYLASQPVSSDYHRPRYRYCSTGSAAIEGDHVKGEYQKDAGQA